LANWISVSGGRPLMKPLVTPGATFTVSSGGGSSTTVSAWRMITLR